MHENAFEDVVCEMATILSKEGSIKAFFYNSIKKILQQ